MTRTTTPDLDIQALDRAIKALGRAAQTVGYATNAHIRDGALVFSLVDNMTGRPKQTQEFDCINAAMDFVAKQKRKPKVVRPEPERQMLGSLGDCLGQVARYSPAGYSKITAVQDIDGEIPLLHLESTTAAMWSAPVTIFIRAGVTPEYACEILRECAKNLKTYKTLEPWTPKEFSQSMPFDDNSDIPF
jgi:hypothetical protein